MPPRPPTKQRHRRRQRQRQPAPIGRPWNWPSGGVICLSPAPSLSRPAAARKPLGRVRRIRATGRRTHRAARPFCVVVAGLLLLQVAEELECVHAGATWLVADTPPGQQGGAQPKLQWQPKIHVDTKFWARNLELGDEDNWRARSRPCTLLERVAIEQSETVISMDGDSLAGWRLESPHVRELVLAPDGVLLLAEDSLSSKAPERGSPAPARHSNTHSAMPNACHDSAMAHGPLGAPAHPWFVFAPDASSLSWFEPGNWRTEQGAMVARLMPDSHKIPCAVDVVVFGERPNQSLEAPSEGRERAARGIVPFKVNFRPEPSSRGLNGSLTSGLRVAKLKIAGRSYSQHEFEQLLGLYGDMLFDFRDDDRDDDREDDHGYSRSVFGESLRRSARAGRLDMLTIDESSIQSEPGLAAELCHDEAGCVCGNEQESVMQIICSFHEPLTGADLPCRDPIQVAGYCNKICATTLALLIDPDKFKEGLLASFLIALDADFSEGYFSEHIFVSSRRVEHNRYEISLLPVPTSDQVYEQILGREVELAERIREHLSKAATKSFYGIWSISVRSSTDWRGNTEAGILWASFAISSSLFLLMFAHNEELFSTKPLAAFWRTQWARLANGAGGSPSGSNALGLPHLGASRSVNSMALLGPHHDQEFAHNSPAEDNCDPDLALVEIDTRSITGSTCNLIEPDTRYKH